jgi:hypothetical protein
MNEIIKSTTPPLKLSKPFLPPVTIQFIDNLQDIEKAQEFNMFPRPQSDINNFDKLFENKKVNDIQMKELEKNKQFGIICRVMFINECK